MLCACTARSNMSCCAVICTHVYFAQRNANPFAWPCWLAHELHAAGAGVHVWSEI